MRCRKFVNNHNEREQSVCHFNKLFKPLAEGERYRIGKYYPLGLSPHPKNDKFYLNEGDNSLLVKAADKKRIFFSALCV